MSVRIQECPWILSQMWKGFQVEEKSRCMMPPNRKRSMSPTRRKIWQCWQALPFHLTQETSSFPHFFLLTSNCRLNTFLPFFHPFCAVNFQSYNPPLSQAPIGVTTACWHQCDLGSLHPPPPPHPTPAHIVRLPSPYIIHRLRKSIGWRRQLSAPNLSGFSPGHEVSSSL